MKSKQHQRKEAVASFYTSLERVSRNIRQIELPAGCTPERFRTLSTIQTHGPISVTRLADIEDVRPATMSRMISALESDGLVRRKAAKDDKRSVLITASSKGQRLCERTNHLYLKRISDALTKLDPAQVELISELACLLEKLSTALRR